MNGDSELFDKADALLARYRAASTPDFPVLTEIVDLELTPSVESGSRTGDPASPATSGFETALMQLEARLENEIMRTLETHPLPMIDHLLATRLRHEIESSVIEIIEKIAPSIRQELIGAMREALIASVRTELQRLDHIRSK